MPCHGKGKGPSHAHTRKEDAHAPQRRRTGYPHEESSSQENHCAREEEGGARSQHAKRKAPRLQGRRRHTAKKNARRFGPLIEVRLCHGNEEGRLPAKKPCGREVKSPASHKKKKTYYLPESPTKVIHADLSQRER